MKKRFTYIHFAGLLVSGLLAIFVSACSDELEQTLEQQPQVEMATDDYQTAPSTLSVSLNQANTRLIFEAMDYEGRAAFKSTWSEGDGFLLVGTKPAGEGYITEDPSQSMEYLLIDGAGTTEGLFSSKDESLSSSTFCIYYPSTLKSYSNYALFSYEGQVQKGDDNYDHLADYHTMSLQWISDLDNIVFNTSSEDFSQSSCMKFILKGLPETFIPVSLQLSIVDAEGNTLIVLPQSNNSTYGISGWTLNLEGFSPTNSLTAYLMASDQDVTLPSGAQMRVSITGSNGEYYYADKPAGGKTIQGGCLNTLTITEGWTKPYESTDFSADGKAYTLQTASEGNGINVVLMGDAFSDRQIADGTYEKVMQQASDAFFSEEPYASFRDMFNVYYVNAVSQNEGYFDGGETAFSCYFGEGTRVGGNDGLCMQYAQAAFNFTDEQMQDVLIIVMMNSTRYAGTCWMYHNTGYTSDYGRGTSVAYFPIGTTYEDLATILHHEAGGHGFAKLNDEYAYEYMGMIPANEIRDEQNMRENYGWGKNTDYIPDPARVYWSKFIADSRYASENIGVYEGACTYWTGAYRPTENSIMNDNTGGFNAPSREAIYYRIHKLAYGESWTYDYEEFVNWDLNQRARSRVSVVPQKKYPPTAPPVVIKARWENGRFVYE